MKKQLKKAAAPILGMALLMPTAASAEETGSGADLRADLDYLLSEHFVLATNAMVKDYLDAPDEEAFIQALDQNAADMTPAIASIYGEEGAAEFERIFRGHNDYTADIVAAAQAEDDAARAAAEEEVEAFVTEFSAFLATATEGNLPQDAAEEAIRAHEEDVLAFFDAYVAEDYVGAFEAFREGYDHMFVISEALSGAIATQYPDQFGGDVSSAASDLRSTLNSLAGEHHALAVMGMISGIEGTADYDFVTWAEDMHTQDFKAAIASIYGDEAAGQFESVWTANHIEAEGALAAGLAAGDEEAVNTAKEQFATFANDFGAFLGAATEENLPTEDAQAAVLGHEELKQEAAQAYADGDYDTAVMKLREGYQYMYGVGEALGGAIAAQFPDQFGSEMPGDMPNAGLGGSQTEGNPDMALWTGLGVMALAAGGVFAVRRRTQN
ncbi:copper amine oxidase [Jeotgalibacillus aurantiacus]|uniref:copper amine oxidase n=1 Tax=Jeotgalibacillus aurantiacus TaxID=2763266 RepID=UPI001D0A32D5|nr:copper amine oxidase [Jeotgalibacillus aurantiacus]